MFIKPFKVKSNVQLKGSDIKKLKTRLSQQFKIEESEASQVFPNKASYSAVKIITHAEQQVTVYTADKRPMLFELQDKLYPTLYTLWILPRLVPYFTTHPQVVPRLYNGADLMMPGVVKEGSDLKSFGRFQKNDIVAINLTSNSSAIAVGTLARSSEDLYMAGGQGICVKSLHVFGDKLWGMEATVTQQVPLNGPVLKAPSLNNQQDFPSLGSDPSPQVDNVVQQIENINIESSTENISTQEQGDNESEEIQVNPDKVLKNMFLSALKLNRKDISNTMPILVGTFYPLYVQKQVQPNPDKPITVKDTSYKKLSTFMKKMSDEGFIVVREENKGVEKIISINYDHPELISHIPQKPNNSTDDANKNSETSSHLLLTKMTELYVVNDSTKKLFNSLGVADGKALDKLEIKNYVKDYVSRNKLINATTKEVILNDVLVEICVGKRENDEPISMKLENVIAIVQSQMNETFEMRSQAGGLAKGGKRAIIQITTATRMGNKKVTLVSNLESFGINIESFSKACKVGVQASTAMTKVPGTNINQFQIQGNHVRFIYNLLTDTYKVPKNDITGLEYAKKENSKKKK
ncbi:eukaryotic translation initiation factor 2D [Chironomus tepperi]|uniref:eukaryotic translation initiation factor 2D n=1 Tax=Chironomus tepperi TaxID=113505 RepID=UPI00391FA003